MSPIEWFFAGALATGAISGGLALLLRDFAIPWLLEKVKAGRERASELEREGRAHDREDEPVRQRVVEKVRALLRGFKRVFVRGSFTLEEWQTRHNQIYELVDSDSGARALGSHYRDAMEALNYDQLWINVQADAARTGLERTRRDGHVVVTTYVQRRHDAHLTQIVSAVTHRFVDLLMALGEQDADAEFGDIARRAEALAEVITSDAGPYN